MENKDQWFIALAYHKEKKILIYEDDDFLFSSPYKVQKKENDSNKENEPKIQSIWNYIDENFGFRHERLKQNYPKEISNYEEINHYYQMELNLDLNYNDLKIKTEKKEELKEAIMTEIAKGKQNCAEFKQNIKAHINQLQQDDKNLENDIEIIRKSIVKEINRKTELLRKKGHKTMIQLLEEKNNENIELKKRISELTINQQKKPEENCENYDKEANEKNNLSAIQATIENLDKKFGRIEKNANISEIRDLLFKDQKNDLIDIVKEGIEQFFDENPNFILNESTANTLNNLKSDSEATSKEENQQELENTDELIKDLIEWSIEITKHLGEAAQANIKKIEQETN